MLWFLSVFLFFSEAGGSWTLRSLKDVSSRSFQLSSKERALYVVFQKDCQACQKQVRRLACLDIPIYLIGSFANEKDLRKEFQKMGRIYPAYLGSPDFLQALGAVAGITPQNILYAGGQRYHFRGLTNCLKIKEKLYGVESRG